MSREVKHYTIFTNQAADTTSGPILTTDFRHHVFHVKPTTNANLTVKFKTGEGDPHDPPDFTVTSEVRDWDYVQEVELIDGTKVAGDTGIVYSGTGTVERAELNINYADWVAVEIDNYVAGDVTIDFTGSSN